MGWTREEEGEEHVVGHHRLVRCVDAVAVCCRGLYTAHGVHDVFRVPERSNFDF
jgi:hypothetical protein